MIKFMCWNVGSAVEWSKEIIEFMKKYTRIVIYNFHICFSFQLYGACQYLAARCHVSILINVMEVFFYASHKIKYCDIACKYIIYNINYLNFFGGKFVKWILLSQCKQINVLVSEKVIRSKVFNKWTCNRWGHLCSFWLTNQFFWKPK